MTLASLQLKIAQQVSPLTVLTPLFSTRVAQLLLPAGHMVIIYCSAYLKVIEAITRKPTQLSLALKFSCAHIFVSCLPSYTS